MKHVSLLFMICIGCFGLFFSFKFFKGTAPLPLIPTLLPIRQDLKVEIKTVGELEAAHSLIIASSIKGDQGKIIDLIQDGVSVEPGQVLIRLDPTPFEEKRVALETQVKEQEAYLSLLEQTIEWEKNKADHETRTVVYEVEVARLELDKILYGEGPQERARLKGVMQKAKMKVEELASYSQDLIQLEEQGFLNHAEVKLAQKKLVEEEEAYAGARLQYESYVEHVLPMQIKKGEMQLKRAELKQEESAKAGLYQIAKSVALFEQGKQALADLLAQLQEAEREVVQTEIVAPASGMVVLREDYRGGQRRKPRVGDILVKNQPLIDLPDLSAMIVKTRVRERDLFKVDIGKKATVKVDAYPHLSFAGTVSLIGILALSDLGRASEEKYFEVRIALEKSAPCLRPGMTAHVTLHAQEAPQALTVPLQTVFCEEQETFCYAFDPFKGYEKRPVCLGISNEQWVEVLAGVKEEEKLCLLPPLLESH